MIYSGRYGFTLGNGTPMLHMGNWEVNSEVPMEEINSFDVQSIEQSPGVGSWSASFSGNTDFGNTSNQALLWTAHNTSTPVMFVFGLYNNRVTGKGEEKYSPEKLKNMTFYQGLAFINSYSCSFDSSGNAETSIELTGSGPLSLMPDSIKIGTMMYAPIILSPGKNAITSVNVPLIATGDRDNYVIAGFFTKTGETYAPVPNSGFYFQESNGTKAVVGDNSAIQSVIPSNIISSLGDDISYSILAKQTSENNIVNILQQLTADNKPADGVYAQDNVKFSDASGSGSTSLAPPVVFMPNNNSTTLLTNFIIGNVVSGKYVIADLVQEDSTTVTVGPSYLNTDTAGTTKATGNSNNGFTGYLPTASFDPTSVYPNKTYKIRLASVTSDSVSAADMTNILKGTTVPSADNSAVTTVTGITFTDGTKA